MRSLQQYQIPDCGFKDKEVMVKLLFQNVSDMINNRDFCSVHRAISSFFVAQRADLVQNGLKPQGNNAFTCDKR